MIKVIKPNELLDYYMYSTKTNKRYKNQYNGTLQELKTNINKWNRESARLMKGQYIYYIK